MIQNVKIIVGDVPTQAEIIINGQHIEPDICGYTLEHEACQIPILHLHIPILRAEIEIGKCEAEEHEVSSGV